jgi:hypothetical protein
VGRLTNDPKKLVAGGSRRGSYGWCRKTDLKLCVHDIRKFPDSKPQLAFSLAQEGAAKVLNA